MKIKTSPPQNLIREGLSNNPKNLIKFNILFHFVNRENRQKIRLQKQDKIALTDQRINNNL